MIKSLSHQSQDRAVVGRFFENGEHLLKVIVVYFGGEAKFVVDGEYLGNVLLMLRLLDVGFTRNH